MHKQDGRRFILSQVTHLSSTMNHTQMNKFRIDIYHAHHSTKSFTIIGFRSNKFEMNKTQKEVIIQIDEFEKMKRLMLN